ncbi:MAG: ABC transporter ATP-binding protein [Sandaracinaceae bacterium]
MAEPVLRVRDLATTFETDLGDLRAIEGVSFDLYVGRTLCLVGESGCGKSVTALSVMGLLPDRAFVSEGAVYLGVANVAEGAIDLTRLSETELGRVRGRHVAMIFQDPTSALNPVHTLGDQIAEGLMHHLALSKTAARARAAELLAKVGIPAPAERLDAYPHQISGGMRQRVMIAMAIACGPRVLVADEPTTALDVTIQAQVLELLRTLRDETGMAVLLITHDLGVVAEVADEVAVMYAGRIVERAPVRVLFNSPRHPYTRALLRSMPSRAFRIGDRAPLRLPTIAGVVPSLGAWPKGCRFQDRCDVVEGRCRAEEPSLRRVGDAEVACFVAGAPDVAAEAHG